MAFAPGLLALAVLASSASPSEAEKLARRSIVEYNAGEFERALTDATQAYELDPRPAILYNLGQCHRALEHWKQALFFYRGFLREQPDAPNRAAVLALIEEMDARLKGAPAVQPPAATAVRPAPEAQLPATPAAPRPPVVVESVPAPQPVLVESAPPQAIAAEPARAPIPVATWWLGGAAIAAGAAGTILGAVAASTLSGDHPMTSGGYTVHTIPASQYQAGQNESLTADLLWGVGGALLITAAVVFVAR